MAELAAVRWSWTVESYEQVWIVSLPERAVHVHTRPDRAAGRYDSVRTVGPGGRLTAEALGIDIAVDEVLPPDA